MIAERARSAFVARELAPAGVRSAPKVWYPRVNQTVLLGAAAQPSGSKLPRHRDLRQSWVFKSRIKKPDSKSGSFIKHYRRLTQPPAPLACGA
ncbi:hypothetical protein CEQ51_12225 [Pseudomonas thivervalensis]|uniref:Uncharacterized protein n=1 Tax=Pseudomonas thivervalensis TaxID=86265 RepID=A0A2Z4ZBC2_9PSED|nr:hypothetical protein CE140_12350 [Pseudomonas thivervalensis]AXA60801.1 hypothetical protein CEQ51_12225 [Pseudomonas thivervalensis]